MLDEVEEGELRPVEILQHEDERALACEGLDQLADGPEGLLSGPAPPFRHTDRLRDAVGYRRGVGLVPEESLDARPIQASGRGPHNLRQGPERDPLAVGKAAPHEDGRPPLHGVDQLLGETGLSDPGVTEHREYVCCTPRDAALEGLHELCELGLPADDRVVLGRDRVAHEAAGALVDQDLAGSRCLQQAGGDLCRLSGEEARGRLWRGELTGAYARPDRHRDPVVAVELVVQARQRSL